MASSLFEIVAPQAPDAAPAIMLRVHLMAGAGRTEVIGSKEAALVVRSAAPPRAAQANAEVRRVVAELFGVDTSAVELRDGETRADKQFVVTGLTGELAERLLALSLRTLRELPGARGRVRPGR